MQPCGFCSSWFPVCWHNPVIRPKQRINCSSNSRLPLIHLLKPFSLPQPVWFSTPGLAWRSLKLITSKDLINVLSLYKTVWSAPCIRKGQSLWGIFDCEFLTFFMELWMVGCGRFLSSVCVLAPFDDMSLLYYKYSRSSENQSYYLQCLWDCFRLLFSIKKSKLAKLLFSMLLLFQSLFYHIRTYLCGEWMYIHLTPDLPLFFVAWIWLWTEDAGDWFIV